jgi:hypothetical protein
MEEKSIINFTAENAMLSHEVKNFLSNIEAEMQSLTLLIESIDSISNIYKVIESQVQQIAEGGPHLNGNAAQLHAELTNSSTAIAKIGGRKFYSELDRFEKLLEKIEVNLPSSSSYISKIIQNINILSDRYDNFIAVRTGVSASQVLFQAHLVNIDINKFTQSVNFFAASLSDEQITIEKHLSLTLFLPAKLEFKEFIEKLSALESIYSELCQIFEISESDEPLRISKIESGSLWASIFGNSTIVALMAEFLKSSAHFLYRNYTAEGKISAIPSKLESLNSVLDFSNKLSAKGIDVSEMQDQVAKAGVVIAKDLTRLLEKQSTITVNDAVIPLGPTEKRNLLEMRAPKQIGNNTEEQPLN